MSRPARGLRARGLRAGGRGAAVAGFLLAGAVGVVSSTQTWLTAARTDAGEPLAVAGADAVPLLAPLSLAVLALGAALSIAGSALRYAFAALGAAAAVVLAVATAPLVADPPLSVVAPAVTEATGLAGEQALRDLVAAVDPTAWPAIALAGWVLLLAASVFTAATARGWRGGGRRYRTDAGAPRRSGPLDPVDSWDDMSHGTDPTAR
ncbi:MULTISPECIES: Trp biosynthesis-associated membrane protein [Microbacterium]|uniref:Trp biosynthesis-associated membrane protein n=1 Tax=Microbacterium TaxID=33882 RepID=UPI00217F11F0|nr:MULTISPECIES: Trp biosynthesis-associated membrane protein [Microbacterium]UWF76556.1 Trp biosynthesis-associated membrane protein [Microbacterium neungamense]WCM54709.1 Trp biosynthesis-associated membrane protein [Microbacterium sp. EF45047]